MKTLLNKIKCASFGMMVFTSFAYSNATKTDEFGGIGVQIVKSENEYLIQRVLKDSPAENSGLQAGDVLVEVDDVSTQSYSMQGLLQEMRGEVGEALNLKIQRNDQYLEKEMTRIQLKLSHATVLELGLQNREILYKDEIQKSFVSPENAIVFVDNEPLKADYREAPSKKNYRLYSVELEKEALDEKVLLESETRGVSFELPNSGSYEIEYYDANGSLLESVLKYSTSSFVNLETATGLGAEFILIKQNGITVIPKHSF